MAESYQSPLGTHRPTQDPNRNSFGYFARTQWQNDYDYGTIFYAPAQRWQDDVELHNHIIGVELTPGIVRTRLNETPWRRGINARGSLYFVEAGSTIEISKEQPIDFILATVDRDKAAPLFEESGISGELPRLTDNMLHTDVDRLANRLRFHLMRSEGDVAVCASELVFHAIDCMMLRGRVRFTKQRYHLAPYQIHAALEFIDENLSLRFSVETLAQQTTGLSGHYFAHAFTEMLGHSPYQYVITRRLSRACELVVRTRQSLADIAYAVGFSSQAHMTSVFCKRLGITPLSLRKLRSVRTVTGWTHKRDTEAMGSAGTDPG